MKTFGNSKNYFLEIQETLLTQKMADKDDPMAPYNYRLHPGNANSNSNAVNSNAFYSSSNASNGLGLGRSPDRPSGLSGNNFMSQGSPPILSMGISSANDYGMYSSSSSGTQGGLLQNHAAAQYGFLYNQKIQGTSDQARLKRSLKERPEGS
jgi:hypothetical protein